MSQMVTSPSVFQAKQREAWGSGAPGIPFPLRAGSARAHLAAQPGVQSSPAWAPSRSSPGTREELWERRQGRQGCRAHLSHVG